jgi:hypothetical protein
MLKQKVNFLQFVDPITLNYANSRALILMTHYFISIYIHTYVERLIVYMSLSVNLFLTLATQLRLVYRYKAPCITIGSHIEP